MAFAITASPLSCQCGAVTITASDISTTPSRWAVFLFYKAVTSDTPFYSGPLDGNYANPITDTYFDVTIPMNATYTFIGISLKPFDITLTYGLNDWTFNPVDGKIYISNAGSNTNNVLDNQVWWRQLDSCDYEDVPLKVSNVLSSSFARATVSLPVTCNTSFLGLSVDMEISCETSVETLALVDGTGKFSFSCNPNGYGGVNPYRGDYAQMAILTNTRSDGTFYEYQARTYSYRSAAKYYFDIPRDGLYVLNLFLVQLFGNKSYYNANEAVFEEVLNTFWVSLVDNNTEPIEEGSEFWAPITDYAGFVASSYYSLLNFYFVQDNNGKKVMYDLQTGIQASCPCGCSGGCGDDLFNKYMFVLMCITSACTNRDLGRYSEAQCFLERIPKNCAPYISARRC
jgi:hypothetical protein